MKLLYAIDLRDPNGWMIAQAAGLAARLGATLDLIYVDPFGKTRTYVLDPEIHALLTRELDTERKRREAQLAQLLDEAAPGVRGQIHVVDGDAVDEVVKRSEGYDMVVVGTHGRRGIQRMFLGSVAERIVRHALVDTLVLRHAPH